MTLSVTNVEQKPRSTPWWCVSLFFLLCIYTSGVPLCAAAAATGDVVTHMSSTTATRSVSTHLHQPFPHVDSHHHHHPVAAAVAARQVVPPVSAATAFNPADIPRVNAEVYANNTELFIDPFVQVSTTFELIPVPSASSDPNWPYSVFPWVPVQSPSPVPVPISRFSHSSSSFLPAERQPTTISPCRRSSCAARVTITSGRFLRWKIVKAAHRRLAQVIGFSSVFVPNSRSKVIRRGQNTFVVIVQFNAKYLREIQPLIP